MNLPLLAALWLAWVIIGAVLERRARRNTAAVPHRILVSGGRGKTTLVRLIHAGLCASDCRAAARVSGDEPLVIGPDGAETRQRRWGGANIRELRRLMNRLPKMSVDAAVVENMAIDPRLQAVVAQQIVRPTLSLMAPDAVDHLEIYPAAGEARADLQMAALPPGSDVILSGGGELDSVFCGSADRLGLEWATAPVIENSGLRPHMTVLAGMALAAVDRVCGATTVAARTAVVIAAEKLERVNVTRRGRIAWVDGLSVNDPDAASALASIVSNEARRRGYATEARLFNHRSDRPSRLPVFAGVLGFGGPVWVAGDSMPPHWPAKIGVPRLQGSPREIVAAIEDRLADCSEGAWVLCLGNSGGMGRELRQWLSNHGREESW